jgi:peroxiredoxin
MMPLMLAFSAFEGSKLAGSRVARSSVSMAALPADVTLDVGFPPTKLNVAEYAKGKNIILMGLPGAFTGT